MSPETAADTAVLASAILMLLAIASKLVTANLVTRSKRVYAKLEVTRREIAARLKEVQLKRTSARGTLEFWERRRTETSQKVQDATRDLENYEAQFEAEGDFDIEAEALSETDADELAEHEAPPLTDDQDGAAAPEEGPDPGEVAEADPEAANADDEADEAEGQEPLPQSK